MSSSPAQQGKDFDDTEAIARKARSLYNGLSLAPMVRASTTPLRALALQYGADFVYTEELVDRALMQTIRVENKELQTIDYVKDPALLPKKVLKRLKAENNRPCLILRIDPKLEAGKLVLQLGTGEPDLALKAARHVYKDVDAIDINMGCPKKFSISGGMGSALLEDPTRAADIISTLKQEIPLPISCKIRLLKDVEKTAEFIETMMRAGVDALAIHARRVGHDATVKADWQTLEQVLAILGPKYPEFPFMINGDFYDRSERTDFMRRTRAKGMLLARPALYNTSTFLPQNDPLVDKTIVVQEYLKHTLRYDYHFKNTKYVICEMMSNRRTPTERVSKMPLKFPGGQTVQSVCNCKDMKTLCQLWNVEYDKSIPSATPLDDKATAKTTNTMVAGDHKYLDSYFLKGPIDQVEEEKKADESVHVGSLEPESKRIKTDNHGDR
jgi:tRNA-dihydrouridine synthase 2